MKPFLSEKKIVVILFVLVLIAFSFAQEDSRKMEKLSAGINAISASHLLADQSTPIIENVTSGKTTNEE
jgi:hypothetical protein